MLPFNFEAKALNDGQGEFIDQFGSRLIKENVEFKVDLANVEFKVDPIDGIKSDKNPRLRHTNVRLNDFV